jgi:hypothetical protein
VVPPELQSTRRGDPYTRRLWRLVLHQIRLPCLFRQHAYSGSHKSMPGARNQHAAAPSQIAAPNLAIILVPAATRATRPAAASSPTKVGTNLSCCTILTANRHIKPGVDVKHEAWEICLTPVQVQSSPSGVLACQLI